MRLNNMPPKNKEWLELLSNSADIAWFLEDKDMIDNADTIRTAIDLLKFLIRIVIQLDQNLNGQD